MIFDLFKRTKGLHDLVFNQAADPLVDIHGHWLPGVDDGAADEAASTELLAYMDALQIKRAYCTPHVMEAVPNNNKAFLTKRFEVLLAMQQTERLKPVSEQTTGLATLDLRLAAEYMLDVYFEKHLAEGLLGYAGNKVLLETSYMAPPRDFLDLLYKVQLAGYHVILAHPERYIYMDAAYYNRLIDLGVQFQLNLLSVSGYYGKRAQEKALTLLDRGAYSYVGLDLHRLGMRPGIKDIKLSAKRIDLIKGLYAGNATLWG